MVILYWETLKNKYWIIPFLIISIFILEYHLIMRYIEMAFLYNEEIKKEVLAEEKVNFYMNITEKGVLTFLQLIVGVLCLNIGLLYYKHKIKISKVIKIIAVSFISLAITQYIIVFTLLFKNYVFTTSNIENIENKLYLTNYFEESNISSYLILPLQTFNITHLFFFLILAYEISTIIHKNYFKSLLFTFKTYGVGVVLWFVFALIMEMNFN